MADGLSVTGSAFGILSFGLSVSQGLVAYYHTWKRYDSECEETGELIQNLSDLGRAFQNVNRKLRVHPDPDLFVIVQGGLKSLQQAVEALIKRSASASGLLRLQISPRRYLLSAGEVFFLSERKRSIA